MKEICFKVKKNEKLLCWGILREYYEKNSNNKVFSFENMELFLLSKDFNDLCVFGVISLLEQIKIFYSFIVISSKYTIKEEFWGVLAEIICLWGKKGGLETFQREIKAIYEVMGRKFKNLGYLKGFCGRKLKRIVDFKEKKAAWAVLLMKSMRKIWIMNDFNESFIDINGLEEFFLSLLEEKSRFFCIYDKEFKNILKIVYTGLKMQKTSYFYIFNKIFEEFIKNCNKIFKRIITSKPFKGKKIEKKIIYLRKIFTLYFLINHIKKEEAFVQNGLFSLAFGMKILHKKGCGLIKMNILFDLEKIYLNRLESERNIQIYCKILQKYIKYEENSIETDKLTQKLIISHQNYSFFINFLFSNPLTPISLEYISKFHEKELKKKDIFKILTNLSNFYSKGQFDPIIHKFTMEIMENPLVFELILSNDKFFNVLVDFNENYMLFDCFLRKYQKNYMISGNLLLLEKINKNLTFCQINEITISNSKFQRFLNILEDLIIFAENQEIKQIKNFEGFFQLNRKNDTKEIDQEAALISVKFFYNLIETLSNRQNLISTEILFQMFKLMVITLKNRIWFNFLEENKGFMKFAKIILNNEKNFKNNEIFLIFQIFTLMDLDLLGSGLKIEEIMNSEEIFVKTLIFSDISFVFISKFMKIIKIETKLQIFDIFLQISKNSIYIKKNITLIKNLLICLIYEEILPIIDKILCCILNLLQNSLDIASVKLLWDFLVDEKFYLDNYYEEPSDNHYMRFLSHLFYIFEELGKDKILEEKKGASLSFLKSNSRVCLVNFECFPSSVFSIFMCFIVKEKRGIGSLLELVSLGDSKIRLFIDLKDMNEFSLLLKFEDENDGFEVVYSGLKLNEEKKINVILYKRKNNKLKICLDGQKIQGNKPAFIKLFEEKFKFLKSLTIGSSPDKFENPLSELFHFFIMKNYTKHKSDLYDNDTIFDCFWLEFPDKFNFLEPSEINLLTNNLKNEEGKLNLTEEVFKKDSYPSFLQKLIKPKKNDEAKLEAILSNNVFFCKTNKLNEILCAIGIENFWFQALWKLASNNFLMKKNLNIVFAKIISIGTNFLKYELNYNNEQSSFLKFFQKNGFSLFLQLILKFVQNKGFSPLLLESLANFLECFLHLRYKAMIYIFLDRGLWKVSDNETKMFFLNELSKFFMDPDFLIYFKTKNNYTFNLLMLLKETKEVEMTSFNWLTKEPSFEIRLIIKELLIIITNTLEFYMDDKILIEETWILLKFMAFYQNDSNFLVELLHLLNNVLGAGKQIEFIARGTPAISILFFCLKNLQNQKQIQIERESDCCCMIIKILKLLLEKTTNSDFTLFNRKSNNEIQLFIKKFGFKQLSKINLVTAFYIFDNILEKNINLETFIALIELAYSCIRIKQEYFPIFFNLFLKRLNYISYPTLNIFFEKLLEKINEPYFNRLFLENNTIFYFNNFLIYLDEEIFLENKLKLLKIWLHLNLKLFFTKSETEFNIFLNSLWILKENSKFIILLELLSVLSKEITNKFDQYFSKTISINISQILFFLEVALNHFSKQNLIVIDKSIECIKDLLNLITKLDIFYVFQPFSNDFFDISLSSEANIWRKCESQYLKKNPIFKEGGILNSIFNIIMVIFRETVIKKDQKNILELLEIFDRIIFENSKINNNLHEAIKKYEEYFKEIPKIIDFSYEGKEQQSKLFFVKFCTMILYEMLKILMIFKESTRKELDLVLKESIIIQAIMKLIERIFKIYGHEILTEIQKSLHNYKQKQSSTNNKDHYNGVVLDFNQTLRLNEGNEKEESNYNEINKNSFGSLKELYDICLDSKISLEEKFWRIFEDFNLFKIIEMIDVTMLFNQKLVNILHLNYYEKSRNVLELKDSDDGEKNEENRAKNFIILCDEVHSFLMETFKIQTKDIQEKTAFTELKALKQLYRNHKSSLYSSEPRFQRKRVFDELYRQHFFLKPGLSSESTSLKTALDQAIKKIESVFGFFNNAFCVEEIKYFTCEYVTISGGYHGCLRLTKKEICFFTKREIPKGEKGHEYGVPSSFLRSEPKFKYFRLNEIKSIFTRKIYFINHSIELFLKNGHSYFFNLYSEEKQKDFLSFIAQHNPKIEKITKPIKDFLNSGYIEKWQRKEISTYEYLIHLNLYSGRSFNLLFQYPIFPWVVSNYVTDKLDLTDSHNFRNFSCPIGCLNEKTQKNSREKYSDFEDSIIPKFHHGTHYSTYGHILFFLIRLQPFTELAMELQGGKIDLADRLFSDMEGSWQICENSFGDLKELIPEFFYFPYFLLNLNKIDLGIKQTGDMVNNVILPKWAKTPEEFIFRNREALESNFVSENICKWIDLIWGEKQKGEKAINVLNVYYYLTYEGNFDLKSICDKKQRNSTLDQIFYYGQNPIQMFTRAHPSRSTTSKIANYLQNQNSKKFEFDLKESIIYISHSQNQLNLIMRNKKFYVLLKNNLYSNNLEIIQKELKIPKHFEQFDFIKKVNKLKILNILTPAFQNFLIMAGFPHGGVKIFQNFEMIKELDFHKKEVNFLNYCSSNNLLICSSDDGRISFWQLNDQFFNSKKEFPKFIVYGHHSKIVALAKNSILGIVVSADIEGSCFVILMKEEKIYRSFKPILNIAMKERILSININSNGEMLLLTTMNSLYIYNINGIISRQYTIKMNNESEIIYADYLFEKQNKLIIATSKNDFLILDSFSFIISNESVALEALKYSEFKMKKILINPIREIFNDTSNLSLIVAYKNGVIKIVSFLYAA